MTVQVIERWREFVRTHDHALLVQLLDPDVVFESPVVHTPQVGARITALYLIGAEQVLGGPAFRYVGEWTHATGVVLEFETEIDGIRINGVDIIETSTDGSLITRFKVMIRPLKAINLVHQLMGEQLQKLSGAKSS